MRPRFAVLIAALVVAGCTVGPDYQTPSAPIPAAFKELKGWTPAQPASGTDRGPWWSVFDDPVLDGLERQIDVGNQNLRAYEAAYRQALAVIREDRSAALPTLSASPGYSRQRVGRQQSTALTGELTASWDLDLWGKIRREVESASAAAQASQADLADVRLSAQAELATDYVNLRTQDSLILLLQDTVAAYQRSLDIVQNQYAVGVAARSDVITAQTQLQSTRAQLIAAQSSRATNEHAIALLTGRPPAELTIAPGRLAATAPGVPVALPSTLLQQRPDIAAAERTLQNYNAQIGVNVAAYYPSITLSATLGFSGSALSNLVSASNQVWSIAASGTETLIEGGARRAAVDAAQATYEQSVANYRETVLAAFQAVEDQLSTIRIAAEEIEAQRDTVRLARQAAAITLNEYRAGTQTYTAVVTAQATALSSEQSLLTSRQTLLTATVALIKALGGQWHSSALAH